MSSFSRCKIVASAFALLSVCGPLAAGEFQFGTWDYPPTLPEARTETYKTVGDTSLNAYVFEPADHSSNDRRPAIVFFFGGGWRSGTPGQFHAQCKHFAARGLVALTVDYRVSSRHGVTPQECLADAKSAIRWVRQNAERLGVDPERIVAAGGSAGGHLAAATAVIRDFDEPEEDHSISSAPNACILYNPALILTNYEGRDYLDPERTEDLAERTGGRARDLSPIHHVRPQLPPMLILHGEADDVVPYSSAERFAEVMQAAGNDCQLIGFPDEGHGFFNTGRGGDAARQYHEIQVYRRTTAAAENFLVAHDILERPSTAPLTNPNIHFRGSLNHSRDTFEETGRGHVAFLGGSITEMNGYRPLVSQFLVERFPQTRFQFTNAGIASTCSTTGAFRLARDVLQKGPVDLFFVEYAVNDDQDAMHSRTACIRGMEGILRQVREHNPAADIVVIHFVNPPMLETLQSGKTPLSSHAHEDVARHYDVSTVDVASEVARRIAGGTLTWEQYGGTHPAPYGNALASAMVEELLTHAWSRPSEKVNATPQALPEPIDEFHYGNGHFVDPQTAVIEDGWSWTVPDWKSLPGSNRARFNNRHLLCATEPGAELTLQFAGSAVGAYVLAGPDAGTLQCRIDGGEPFEVNLYHHFSKGLHYPRTVMFATELPPGRHTLTLRVSENKDARSSGHAARILQFAVNGE